MDSQKKQQVLQLVFSKAWEDASFRKNLIDNPVHTIEKFAGVKMNLPEGKTLVFVDQTDHSKVYVNLPVEPDLDNVELSEEQLEMIAGGGHNTMNDIVSTFYPNIKDFLKI